jgi:chaperonin GroES
MNLKPLGNRLVVKPIEEDAVRASGLVIPEQALERPQRGMVIACGKDVEEVAVGQEVLYSKYGGTEVLEDGEKFIALREDDVLGVVE